MVINSTNIAERYGITEILLKVAYHRFIEDSFNSQNILVSSNI